MVHIVSSKKNRSFAVAAKQRTKSKVCRATKQSQNEVPLYIFTVQATYWYVGVTEQYCRVRLFESGTGLALQHALPQAVNL
jgi:hypothetical protein